MEREAVEREGTTAASSISVTPDLTSAITVTFVRPPTLTGTAIASPIAFLERMHYYKFVQAEKIYLVCQGIEQNMLEKRLGTWDCRKFGIDGF